MYKNLMLISSILLMSCSSGGDDSTPSAAPTGPTATTATIVVLNNMTPTGLVKDGVTMDAIYGDSSAGHLDETYLLDPPIPYGQSGTITLTEGQCDIFWDLAPFSKEVGTVGNTGVSTFFPCNQTQNCTAVIIDVIGIKFADLEGFCE